MSATAVRVLLKALLLAGVVGLQGAAGYNLTEADVQKASTAIAAAINSADGRGPGEGTATYKVYIAGFIRLAFHSCVGNKCVGCLNVNDGSNNGLNRSVAELEKVRGSLDFNISRGDLWALAAKVAFREGTKNDDAQAPEADAVKFRYGRVDCATSPYTDALEVFPQRTWGTNETLHYFGGLGFDARETVALMGFHTLGVVRDGSKVVAQWVSTPDTINSQFYKDLNDVSKDWTQIAEAQESTNQSIYSWRKAQDNGTRIMINTDIAVVKNITIVDFVTGRSECSVMNHCQNSSTAGYSAEFADNATAWRVAAAAALTKLIERGYPPQALRDPAAPPTAGTTVPTGGTTTPSSVGGRASALVASLCATILASRR